MVKKGSDETVKNTMIIEIEPAVSIPDYMVGEIQSKLAYVDEAISEAQVKPDRIVLLVRSPDLQSTGELTPEQRAKIEGKVQRVVLSLAKGAIKPKVIVLEDYMDRRVPYDRDPMPELVVRGEISQEGNGIYTLGPLLAKLIDYFESRFLALAESFEAVPYRFPTLISAHQLDKVNYFSSFPHSLTFAAHLREDLDIIDGFAGQASCDERGLNTTPESFAQVQALLSPAVCYHLYFALADKPLPNGQITVTAVGNCFRYESINLTSLERLWDFTMREVIFVGLKEFVLDNRETARKRMTQVFEEIGLAYRVESANDPFFIGEFRKQAAFQSAFQLKYEIRASLPFKGSTLAVGSYNYHQDFFGRNFNISLPDDTPAHTGCVAFGLERMAFAFLAQYGLEPSAWPNAVKDAVQ
jgi:seryl-tRNA synthetase